MNQEKLQHLVTSKVDAEKKVNGWSYGIQLCISYVFEISKDADF